MNAYLVYALLKTLNSSVGDTDTDTAMYLYFSNIDNDTPDIRYIGVSKQRHLPINKTHRL